MLPCNVVVESTDAGTRIAAVDPHEIMDDPRFADSGSVQYKCRPDSNADANRFRRLEAAIRHLMDERSRLRQ